MPPIPELTEPLANGRVVLRLAAERDIPEILIAHQDDPAMHASLGMKRPPSGAELGRQLEDAPRERAMGASVTLTILEPGSEECRGQVHARHIEWAHGRAELSVWVAPHARCNGLARSALGLASSWLFGVCGLERVQLLAQPDNEPMIRAARGAGFLHEGVLRAHERGRGSRVDCAVLSLLRTDLRPSDEQP
jgi:RimJ/RimL family protein N-acetyltransferase